MSRAKMSSVRHRSLYKADPFILRPQLSFAFFDYISLPVHHIDADLFMTPFIHVFALLVLIRYFMPRVTAAVLLGCHDCHILLARAT